MRWIVTFLDILVLLLFLSGITIWKNAFPDYLRSTYAHKFSKNGQEIILFLEKNCNLLDCVFWFRPPDFTYNIAFRNSNDFFYHYLSSKHIGIYQTSLETPPPVWPFKTSNGFRFIAVKEKEYSYPPEFYLYALSKDEKDTVTSVLFVTVSTDSSEITEYSDKMLLGGTPDNQRKTFCKIHDPRFAKFLGQKEPQNYSRQEKSLKNDLSDSAHVHALYEVFSQMQLKPNCIDSLKNFFEETN